ncbi:MAG: nuclear transport factor 2 family protein [Nitrospirae bacterium]|nr:nuclear transport factor 2 family protein [Nitrospirota bacterium]
MKAAAEAEKQIFRLLDDFAEGYSRKDINGMLSLYSTDSDLVFYGTGADEKRVGIEEIKLQLERDFTQTDSLNIKYEWRLASCAGEIAWVAADTTINAIIEREEYIFPGRLTLVLKNTGGRWLIVQGHLSLPLLEQKEEDLDGEDLSLAGK